MRDSRLRQHRYDRLLLPLAACAFLLAGCGHQKPCTQPATRECDCCESVCPATSAPVTRASQSPAVQEPVQVSNGDVDLIVDPAKGRILHFAFSGKPNLLWTNDRAIEFAPKYGRYRNWGGDKLWVWPQSWGWPPPVPEENWSVEKEGRTIRMISRVASAYNLRMIRTIELAEKGPSVTITSRFEPVMPQQGPSVAAWSVTQIPATPYVLVRSSTAAGGVRLSGAPAFNVHPLGADTLWLERKGAPGGKVLMDADCLLALLGDVAFIQRDLSSTPAVGVGDSASRAQVYSHSDYNRNIPDNLPRFIELEFISATVPLLSAASLELKVQWTLVNLQGKDQSPQALAELMR